MSNEIGEKKLNLMNELFLTMNENDRVSVQKIQSIYQALLREYDVEIKKENMNHGKLLCILSQSAGLDTIILHAITNQINVAIENSPLRFHLNSMSMVNNYLVSCVNNYEKNELILQELFGLATREDVLGYLEVINYINNVIQELQIFEEKDIEFKNLNELTKEEIPTIEVENKIKVVELEDGITITT